MVVVMSEERRYGDREVAEILERATSVGATEERADRPVPASEAGLTLSELEQIGREVGIHPQRIADAAHALDRAAVAHPVERYLGAARSVARTLQIERALTDEQWARLVGDLRRTFKANGKTETHGALRSWSNGNLQVHVEPDDEGYAIRMTTRKGNVTQLTLVGMIFTVMSVAIAAGALLGLTDDTLAKATFFAALGLGQITWARATLPGWARTRGEQMDALAERITLMLEEGGRQLEA